MRRGAHPLWVGYSPRLAYPQAVPRGVRRPAGLSRASSKRRNSSVDVLDKGPRARALSTSVSPLLHAMCTVSTVSSRHGSQGGRLRGLHRRRCSDVRGRGLRLRNDDSRSTRGNALLECWPLLRHHYWLSASRPLHAAGAVHVRPLRPTGQIRHCHSQGRVPRLAGLKHSGSRRNRGSLFCPCQRFAHCTHESAVIGRILTEQDLERRAPRPRALDEALRISVSLMLGALRFVTRVSFRGCSPWPLRSASPDWSPSSATADLSSTSRRDHRG